MFSKKIAMTKITKKGGSVLIGRKGGKTGSTQALLKQVIKDDYLYI